MYLIKIFANEKAEVLWEWDNGVHWENDEKWQKVSDQNGQCISDLDFDKNPHLLSDT